MLFVSTFVQNFWYIYMVYMSINTHSILYFTYHGFLSQQVQVLKITAKIERHFSLPYKRFHLKQS